MNAPPDTAPRATIPAKKRSISLFIAAIAVVIVVVLILLVVRAESKTNKVALAAEPKPVTVVVAKAADYRATRTYVGRLDPWISASVGPQFVSAYVDAVLVRPGDVVKKGQVLATLDCRNANAAAEGIAAQARALDVQQKALTRQTDRVGGLLDGGFVSPNEFEQNSALSTAKQAELMAEKAKLLGTSLEVNDCILRAPFDGDVAARLVDPGAFVRPGMPMISVVDRTIVRMTADTPENDFDIVAPNKKVRLLEYATGREIDAVITRRSPAADPGTRTVHIEIDVPDPHHEIPVGTTGEARVDVGAAVAAIEMPLSAATMRDAKATVYIVQGGIAHKKSFMSLGEANGMLFANPSDMPAGTDVVTEGRGLLKEGDPVAATREEPTAQMPDGSVTAEAKP